MPPNTRASAISATAAEKLANDRVPGRSSDVKVKGELSPNMAARIDAAEPLTVEWPDGYSGCGGVPDGRASSHGVHAVSGSVLALPSVSAKRIAVIGRQNTYRYLRSKQAIAASAMETPNKANRCAFAVKFKDRLAEIYAATRFQNNAAFPAQNSANSVWSAERDDPVKIPITLLSL